MKRAIILRHVPFEGPGRVAELLSARGYELDVRELHLGATVPQALEPDEVLVVMGGPMGVADVDKPELPFLRKELDLLERCIADDAPVLGICLGAQLLAAAAGAPVRSMVDMRGERAYEVGWAPVRFHHENASALLAGMAAESPMLHWHGDMFELPEGARRLASTSTCMNQAFMLGSRGFGVQFHAEVGANDIEAFLYEDASFVVRANGPGGVEQLRRDTRVHLQTFTTIGSRLLGNILNAMTR